MISIKNNFDPIVNDEGRIVYPPSDDTYIIIDYFKKKINHNRFDGIDIRNINKIVDIGTGTGIIAIYLQLLKQENSNFNPEIYASDILEEAIKCAKKNEILNKIENQITFIHSNLFENFPDVLKHSFDIIIFNPPYLPSSKKINKKNYKAIDKSWDGGKEGYELILRFLKDAKEFLNDKSKSYIYFISSSITNLSVLDNKIEEFGFKHKVLDKKHILFEDIILNRLEL